MTHYKIVSQYFPAHLKTCLNLGLRRTVQMPCYTLITTVKFLMCGSVLYILYLRLFYSFKFQNVKNLMPKRHYEF